MPREGTSLVNSARIIPGFTKRFKENAPDIGAYERGGTQWTAGVNAIEDTGEGYVAIATYFHIQNRASGKFIRPEADVEGSLIVQAPNTWKGNWAQWEMIPTDGEYFYLKNKQTGNYFRPVTTTDGANLEQKPTGFNGTLTQWKKVETTNGYFYLQNRWSNMYFRPTSNDDQSTGGDYNIVQRPTTHIDDWTQWRFLNIGTPSTNATNVKIKKIAKIITFEVYPNPASKKINIKTGDYNYNIDIYDISGRKVLSNNVLRNSTKELSISNLNSGMYLINYKSENGIENASLKLIVN